MNDYKTLVAEASRLRKEKHYSEAVANYDQAWTKDAEAFNEWEFAGYSHCLRKTGAAIVAQDIGKKGLAKFPDAAWLKQEYAWALYAADVSPADGELKSSIEAARQIVTLTNQADKYSPFTQTVFKVIDKLKKQSQPDMANILSWLELLQPDLLDVTVQRKTDGQGTERKLPSQREQHQLIVCKSLLALARYKECKVKCEQAIALASSVQLVHKRWFQSAT